MAVTVVATADILNESSGAIQVPKGSAGVVNAVKTPPDGTFQVTFTIQGVGGPSTVQKWVEGSLIAFDDGVIGPARFVYEASTKTITTIRYPRAAADFDGVPGTAPVLDADTVEVVFNDGSILRFRAHRSTGTLQVELD
jgi:hypothetical protein